MSRDVGLGAGRSSLAGNTQDSSTRGLLSFLQELGALLQSRRAGQSTAPNDLRLSVRVSGHDAPVSLPANHHVLENTTTVNGAAVSTGTQSGSEDSDGSSTSSNSADDALATTETSGHDDVSATGIDLQAASAWAERAAPFVLLLIIIFLRHHIVGIVMFANVTATIYKCNEILKKEVALKDESSKKMCWMLAFLPVMQIMCTMSVLHRQQLWLNFIVLPSGISGIWECVFKVITVDALIRLGGFVGKSMIMLVHPAIPEENNRRRSQVLSFLEQLLQMYRTVVTVPCWIMYYNSLGMGFFWTWCLHGAFLYFKGRGFGEDVMAAWASGKALMRREFVYGQLVPSTDPLLMESGSTCPICQDAMRTPIKLTCSHLFCDHCISMWLARERTCPMCRTIVRPAGVMTLGDGASSLLPLVF